MQQWGGGYVTDIEYLEGFYADQSPLQMALAATINGVATPDFSGPFAYCELGCGKGSTSIALAAIHPQAQFHAIDFNPAHIAYAREQALAAGLTNATFHECSFADLLGPLGASLPMFDVITMHGVWSWVSSDLHDAIVAFLDARLNSGGLVYVSYNALPGWITVAPLQRILIELAGDSPARSDVAAERAMGMLSRLAEAKIIPEQFGPGLRRMQKALAGGHTTYLVHEYMNRHWRPVYHLDVARAFSRAKLQLAASCELLRNFRNTSLSEEQRALLREVDSSDLRETLTDFCVDTWFRKDVYVRGIRRMSLRQREAALMGLVLTLRRKPPEAFHVDRPDGSSWRPEPLVYQPILRALGDRPHRVSELLALPDIPPSYGISAVELVGVLVGAELAAVLRTPSAEAIAATDRLNRLIDAKDPSCVTRSSVIVAPALGTGILMAALDVILYDELRQSAAPDPLELARRFAALCRQADIPILVDGQPVEDAAKAEAYLIEEYATRIQHVIPLWRMMGIVPADRD